MKKYTLLLLTFTIYFYGISQIPTPGKVSEIPTIIINGTFHIGNGNVIEKGILIIENNSITKIEAYNNAPIDTSKNIVIDAKGKHIYPGFINPNNTLGITEIDAVKATRDFQETGMFNPSVRVLPAFNTESKIITTVRSNGVLITQPTPQSGIISGQSAVMQLDAWNWEDAVLRIDDGIHLNWPISYYWNGKPNKDKNTQLQMLHELFADAKNYTSKTINLKLEALQGLFDGSKTLYIHSNKELEMIESINFALHYGIKNIVLVGANEADKILSLIQENSISIILDRIHSLPNSIDDPIFTPFMLPKILYDNNILFCLSMSGDMEAMNSRNLPFNAGQTVAYGVEYEKAVASITLNSAKILGISKLYGSLEVGKSATLIISNGDALDMRTNQITNAFIDGRTINLTNFQLELYQKYSSKNTPNDK